MAFHIRNFRVNQPQPVVATFHSFQTLSNTNVFPPNPEVSEQTLLYASRSFMMQNREVIQWEPTMIYPPSSEVIDSLLVIRGGDPSTGFYYFEVRITEVKRLPPIIGVGIAPRCYKSGMVGWEDSVGFHSDDGKIFPGHSSGTLVSFGTSGAGDRFGLLVHPNSGTIGFTRNGNFVARALYDPSKQYIPTVTFDTKCFSEFQIIKEPGYFMLGLANVKPSAPLQFLPTTLSALANPPQLQPQSKQAKYNPNAMPYQPSTPQPQISQPQTETTQQSVTQVVDIKSAIGSTQSIVKVLQSLETERQSNCNRITQLTEELNQTKNAKSDVLQRISIDDAEIDRLDNVQLLRVKEQLSKLVAKVQDNIDNADKCVVCLDLRKSVAFLPCKHVCCCTECSDLKTCPLCRGAIADKITLFT